MRRRRWPDFASRMERARASSALDGAGTYRSAVCRREGESTVGQERRRCSAASQHDNWSTRPTEEEESNGLAA